MSKPDQHIYKGTRQSKPRKYHISVGDIHRNYTVVSFAGRTGKRGTEKWDVRCTCGNLLRVTATEFFATNRNKLTCIKCKAFYVAPDSALNRIFRTYRRHAQERNVPFTITLEDVRTLTSGACDYCGVSPTVNSYSSNAKVPLAVNGIDRVDSIKGYTLENCVPCCDICNKAKRNLRATDFIAWIRQAAKWLEGR